MVEFNPDGSLKLPESLAKRKSENEQKMKSSRCIKVRKEIASFTAPKKCILKITLSQAIHDHRFIETIYNELKEDAKTPLKLTKTGEQEYEVEVGSDFKRCSECTSLIGRYREFLYGNLIEEKGNCTFEGRIRSWSEEDYFD
ncbi:hypothetical protein JW826_06215 [Candidatus Woesearchaeota archaeon]|nr:hypothetical protein [Candidatus Woesearchaeota archaeon]